MAMAEIETGKQTAEFVTGKGGIAKKEGGHLEPNHRAAQFKS
jgi:hypothetical protein